MSTTERWITQEPLARMLDDGMYDQFFMLLLAPIAVGTLLTWLAQTLHIEFSTYSYLTVASCGLLLLVFVVTWLREVTDAMRGRFASALWLPLGLALVGIVPALLYNRPYGDAYFYLANVVHYLRYPTESMGFDVKFIATLGTPLQSFIWSTSGPYEYIQGAFAHVFSISVLDIYYFVATGMTGVLIATSLMYLTRLFVPTDEAAVAGAALTLILILCLFEHYRTPGNLYFVHTFAGKFLYLTAVQPIFAAYSLKFLASGRGRYLVYLLVTAIASIGMTASAAVLLPMLAAVLAASFLAVSFRQRLRLPLEGLLRAAKYGICLAPCLVYLIVYQIYFSAGFGSGSPVNAGLPTTLAGHLKLLLFLTVGPPVDKLQPVGISYAAVGISYTAVAFISFSVAALCLTKGFTRQLIALWLVTTFVFFLNPLTGDLLIRLLHLENIYSRVFFILPFPLVAAIVVGVLYERASLSNSARTISAAGCTVLFLFASVLVPYLRGDLIFPPAHKLPSAHNPEFQDVIRIGASLRAGATLAPFEISGLLAIHYPHLKFITMFNEFVWLKNINMQEDAERRRRAFFFVKQGDHSDSVGFLHIVNQYQPENLIVTRVAYESNRSTFNLLSRDYVQVAAFPTYIFYGRRDAAAASR